MNLKLKGQYNLCSCKALLIKKLLINSLIAFIFISGVYTAYPDVNDQSKRLIAADSLISIPPGTSPEETADRDTRKREMLEKKAFTEKAFVKVPINLQSVPTFDQAGIVIEIGDDKDTPFDRLSPAPPTDPFDIITDIPGTKRTDSSFVFLGTAQTVTKTAEIAKKIYVMINDQTAKFLASPSETLIYVDPALITEEARSALNKLDQVEGVAVSIPGFEYAIGVNADRSAIPEYEIEENIFTIDAILLEKTAYGEFISRIPASAKDSIDNKELSLLSHKDAEGKTIASRIRTGCPRTLAKVIAKWAKYGSLGFDFDKDTENIISEGLAMHKNSKNEFPDTSLEAEIIKIIGDDNEALLRISEFMTSHGSSFSLRSKS